ncbi:TetR/AcrR family transcriptional regulator [Streptomyces sp. JL4002]|uniref:TetR/AcrR family transcriptional regulator n=1 Tax=Streptomyces TaxID=1883 RepID=UPI003B285A63
MNDARSAGGAAGPAGSGGSADAAGAPAPDAPNSPTAKGKQRRTALLDAAERILGTSGGAELTMRAVADAAGIRLGHLQYYFPARSDLLAALLDRILAASLARVAALTSADGAGADVEAVLDTVLGEHEDLPLVRLFTEVWSMAAHDEAAAAAVRSFYAAYAAHVAAFVRSGSPRAGAGEAAEGPEATDPAEAASRAEVFVMLMEGSALFRSGITGRPGARTDAVLRRTLLGLLTGGDRPAPGTDRGAGAGAGP